RGFAIDRMKPAIDDFVMIGVDTNSDFLRRIISTDDFALGRLDTAFLDRHPELFTAPSEVPVEAILAASIPLPPGEGSREARGARTRQGEASSEGEGS